MRELLTSLPAAVAYLSGPDLIIDFANEACFRLTGDRDLLGRPLAEAFPELADRIAGYPQSSLLADRAATLETWGLSLDAGLYMEAGLCRPTLSDPEMWEGLNNFVAGNRPQAPRSA